MDIEKFLADFVRNSVQHKRFYHFTDQSNLGLIRKHGLLSTRQLRQKGLLKDVVTGGDANSLATDEAKGTDQYVCLCFTTGHPMQYIARTQRGLTPVYLHISPEIIKFTGVMITNAASNQNGVMRVSASEALDGLDLEVLYKRTDWKLPQIQTRLQAAEKYEILIPDQVPVEAIIHGL